MLDWGVLFGLFFESGQHVDVDAAIRGCLDRYMCGLIRHVSNPPRGLDSESDQSQTYSGQARPRSQITTSSRRVVRVGKRLNQSRID
jgi:hypothetical protein